MSVEPQQPVKAAVVNAAFMSRLENTSTIGKLALNNEDSPSIADVQLELNGSRAFEYEEFILTAGATITLTNSISRHIVPLKSTSGEIGLSTTPFGTGPFLPGTRVTLVCTDGNNPVRIDNNDNANGTALNGSYSPGTGGMIELVWVNALSRFVEIGRNSL